MPASAERQRKRLWRVIGQHVLHLDGVCSYVHDLVAPVHDVAFLGNENVLTFGEKYPLVAVFAAGKAIKLQRNRRRRGRLARGSCGAWRSLPSCAVRRQTGSADGWRWSGR